MNRGQHLLLIGARGTGKTTVGRQLAVRLGRPFADVDDFIEEHAGQTIAEIFRDQGEEVFRNFEEHVLALLCDGPPAVIATGGGAVLRAKNRQRLQNAGFVAWLSGPPELLWERVQADTTTASRRPNLTASGGLSEVRSVLAVREPLYRETATAHFDTAQRSPEDVADAILREWAHWSTSGPPPVPPG